MDEQLPPHNAAAGAPATASQTTTKMTKPRYVKVKVPATVANLGPGFDAIGMAVDIWNEVEVELLTDGSSTRVEIEGEGAEDLPTDETNLVVVGIRAAFLHAATLDKEATTGCGDSGEGKGRGEMPPMHVKCVNTIPPSRGMGSSSAALVGGVLAGLVMAAPMMVVKESDVLFHIACEMEGHPDNVAPAVFGGIQVGTCSEVPENFLPPLTPFGEVKSPISSNQQNSWKCSRIPYANVLQCIMLVPPFPVQTALAREILPATLPREVATFNVSRAALLVAALSTGRTDLLDVAMEDRMHQPYRAPLNLHCEAVMAAAKKAGALGSCLAGSGPTILALAGTALEDQFGESCGSQVQARTVADAMLKAADTNKAEGSKVFMTRPTERGAHVVAIRPHIQSDRILRF